MSEASPVPLDQAALRSAVLAPGSLWTRLDVVGETGSTNEDLLAAARSGAAEGAVLVAERQARGRGRQGRTWITVPGGALSFSVLLRPAGVPAAARGWLPLLTGVAVARAVTEAAGVRVSLKWPNDVLAGGAKLAGILAEQAGPAIVIGIGINVGARQADLPGAPAARSPEPAAPPAAAPSSAAAAEAPAPSGPLAPAALAPTSLALAGAPAADRGALLAAILAELEYWYRAWASPGSSGVPGDPDSCGLRAEYLRWCSTIGTEVVVHLPGGATLTGEAAGVDVAGCLIVGAEPGATAVSAGDVMHVRRVP
ncbi:MAG TPA: biotin--[acetyl-CoA-carboxylase] ligase [Streptosporangiaceae bacterium]|nr:biotin--[acetyl-CoA-carboxylase] ligase [Streptosporangiaceae bacterium]